MARNVTGLTWGVTSIALAREMGYDRAEAAIGAAEREVATRRRSPGRAETKAAACAKAAGRRALRNSFLDRKLGALPVRSSALEKRVPFKPELLGAG